MNAVEIQRVQQRYGSMQVLHDLDLTLGEGEVLDCSATTARARPLP